MLDLENGIKQAQADWPGAKFVDGIETMLNLSKLAGHLADTRARIESMVGRGVIQVSAVTDDGKLLFKMSELPTLRAAYLAELGRLHARAAGVNLT